MSSDVSPKVNHPLWKPEPKPKAPRKQMKAKGKRTLEYEHWRDTVAKPYLDATYGHVCSEPGCAVTEYLDVAHIKGRGSHAELKMVLTNVCYRCRYHHTKADSGFRFK